MDHSQILPKLHVGSCPKGPGDIDQLKREVGITAVLNLQTDGDLVGWEIDWDRLQAHYHASGIQVYRIPIQDFDVDDLRQNLPRCAVLLARLLREGHAAYVHCNVGVNRSPSVAIAHLHWVEQQPLDEAVALVMQRRSCDPYVEAIQLATEDRAKEQGGKSEN